jgi:hypothetical protein
MLFFNEGLLYEFQFARIIRKEDSILPLLVILVEGLMQPQSSNKVASYDKIHQEMIKKN